MTAFSANASALGYFYQVRYALLLLLKADPVQEISLERFDDISFEEEGTPTELIQTKYHGTPGSLSDRSTDLWKTIRVWSEAVLARSVDLENVRLMLVTTSCCQPDSIAEKLRPEETGFRKTDDALKTLQDVAVEENKNNKKGYDAFRTLCPTDQERLVSQIVVLDASPSIVDAGKDITEILTYSTSIENVPYLIESVEGWWLRRVIKHLLGQGAGTISNSELRRVIDDFRERFKSENLPIDFLNLKLSPEEIAKSSACNFVKQLGIIKVEAARVLGAIRDYRRAYEQRSKWIIRDLLYDEELINYESRLVEEWERRFSRMKGKVVSQNDEEKVLKGQSLYDEIEFQVDLPIRKEVTEKYVMRGSYHILADRLAVGWHLDFRSICI